MVTVGIFVVAMVGYVYTGLALGGFIRCIMDGGQASSRLSGLSDDGYTTDQNFAAASRAIIHAGISSVLTTLVIIALIKIGG